MAGLIPQTFIDDLLFRSDIVETINARVRLKRGGKNYMACCPFHQEKTPSFTVSPDKQFYYCFGCGASGNAIGFLMEYDRMSFVDSVKELAALQNLEVPTEQGDQKQYARTKPLYEVLEQANDYYQQQLRVSEYKGRAVSYLKRRGLTGQIAKQFQIGYAPPGWDNLLTELSSQQNTLLSAGMLVEKSAQRCYDRFRDRIMFPIRDLKGRVIGFGGRVLGDDKPKYLNSPETPVFHKSDELYGLYEARQANRELMRVLVVEGYMDVIALAQFEVSNAVATLGTSISQGNLEKLFKFTSEVVFCFDGDKAGRKAALRALNVSLPLVQDGRQIKFLFLDEGEDPDTLIRKTGSAMFKDSVSKSMPLSDFLFQHLSQDLDVSSADGKARLASLLKPYLAKLPASMFRELLIDRLAEMVGLAADRVAQQVIDTAPVAVPQDRAPHSHESHDYSGLDEPQESPEADAEYESEYDGYFQQASDSPVADEPLKTAAIVDKAVRLILLRPALARTMEWSWREPLLLSGLPQLKSIVEFFCEHEQASYASLMGRWQGQSQGRYVASLLAQETLVLEPEAVANELEEAVLAITRQNRKLQLERQLCEAEQQGIQDKTQYQQWLGELQTLK